MTIYPSGPQDNTKYTLTGPDGSVAVFNDETDPNYVGFARWTGLEFADIREAIDDRSGQDGGIQGNNYLSARPITCQVTIRASTTTEKAQKFQKMKRAINALRSDGQLKFTPDGSGGLEMGCRYRIAQPPRSDGNKGWVTTWQFALKAADPYLYGTTLKSANGTSSPVVVTNQGDGLSAPVISMVVTGTPSPVISNLTTNEQIAVTSIPTTGFGMTYIRTLSTNGVTAPQTDTPSGVVVDSAGNVWVSDTTTNRILKFNSSGVYQTAYGVAGSSNPAVGGVPQFNSPTGLARDSSNNIFIADTSNNRVVKMNSSGQWQASFGSLGVGTTNFNTPTDIAIDGSNNIYVTDGNNNRVQKWTSALAYSATFGTLGSGATNLNGPAGIAFDSVGGNLFIVDTNNTRIQVISTAMAAVTRWGVAGQGQGQLWDSFGIETDATGNVLVPDRTLGRIQKFTNAGVYISTTGSFGDTPGQFDHLVALGANAAKTTFYAVDQFNPTAHVQEFSTSPVLVADLGATTLTVGGANVYAYLNVPASSWWKLQPGDNSVRVSGVTSWTMSYRDAWL